MYFLLFLCNFGGKVASATRLLERNEIHLSVIELKPIINNSAFEQMKKKDGPFLTIFKLLIS